MADQTLSDKMAELAETDLCYPESLMWDAWDLLDKSGNTTPTRAQFTEALEGAIRAFHADPIKYTCNPQIRLNTY